MGKEIRGYVEDQTEETQGSEETTGIASCYFNFLPIDSELYDPNNGTRDYDWLGGGLIDGDAPMIESLFTSFQNKTGFIEKMIGNQLTGTAGGSTDVKLKNLTENAIARMHGGGNVPLTYLSVNPGTRKVVYTFSAALATGNIFAWSFKTKNVATGVVSSATAVSVTYATSDAETGDAIETAVIANSGILSAVYDSTGHTLTVICKPGYFIINTVAATLTGGVATLTDTEETDTSIVTTSIDVSNGPITRKSVALATGDGAKIQACINRGTFSGVPGKPQVRILTGSVVQNYEYPHVARVVGDVIYFKEALKNLPADLADVEVCAKFEYPPIGLSLPQNVEIQLDFRNHSDKSAYIVHIPNASHDPGTKAPNFTNEGFKGNLKFVMLDVLMNINGVESLRPYKVTKVNSAVGAD